MKDIEIWEKKLTNIIDSFEFLLQVQKKYLNLKEAFSLVQDSPLILNTVQGPFKNFEKSFIRLIEKIRNKSSVEEALSNPELAKDLAKLDRNFEDRLRKIED